MVESVTYFWNSQKIDRVIHAIKKQTVPESYISPQVTALKCFDLTEKGRISLTAFPEEAIAHAVLEQRDLSGSEEAYWDFWRNAKKWCEEHGQRPRFSWANDLFFALCLDPKGRNTMAKVAHGLSGAENKLIAQHTDESRPDFGGVKYSSSGTNPRAIYESPVHYQEPVLKAATTIAAHLACLEKALKQNEPIDVKGYKKTLSPNAHESLKNSLEYPMLDETHKEAIHSHEHYSNIEKHFEGQPEWKKLASFGQLLGTIGEKKCTYAPCLDGTIGHTPTSAEEWDRQRALRLQRKGYYTPSHHLKGK